MLEFLKPYFCLSWLHSQHHSLLECINWVLTKFIAALTTLQDCDKLPTRGTFFLLFIVEFCRFWLAIAYFVNIICYLYLYLPTEDFQNKISNKLQNYCNSAGIDFIDNSNIERSCLNKGKLDLRRKAIVALAKDLCRFASSFPVDWIITGHEGTFIKYEGSFLDNHSAISEMKNLRLKNPKNLTFWYLNINSVWNKFKNMSTLISKSDDILIVA